MANRKTKPSDNSAAPLGGAVPEFTVVDTSELAGDPDNPRKIADKAAKGLAASLNKFGDLSGLVFNVRTRELVAGHQRMAQIREAYGDLPIRIVDAANGLGVIDVGEGRAFAVRIVDWSRAMQRAANVTANNQKIAGQFTDNLSDYLLSFEEQILDEAGDEFADAVMLMEFVDKGDPGDEIIISASYEVIVQCTDEDHQRAVYEQLTAQGLACKLSTV